FAPQMPEDEEGSSHYGYGWAIFTTPRNTRLIAHNGGNGIFHADFRRYVDDGVVLIIGSNRQDFRSIPAVGPISRLIFNTDYNAPPAVVKVPAAAPGRHAGSYTLPSGGKIHVQALESPTGWPGVTLIPEGKDAFQALTGGVAADMAEREQRLLSAYEKARKGDIGPLAEVYGVPVAELAETNKRTWTNLEAKHGAFQGFELLGTLSQRGRPVTWIEARFERGKSFFENVWDGPNVGFIQVRDKPPGAALYLPESETAFAAYDPARGETARIAFEDGTLVLRAAGSEVRAKREPKG
ncbi:MAG TPA: hypothetical protein VFR31_04640, partial [Thermoanaerobaculia bacterium]|nr:hypothetical protein [Thermoanaerobaculia bacterium]